MEEVLQMKLPWYLLRPKLVVQDGQGYILYDTLFEGYRIDSTLPQVCYVFPYFSEWISLRRKKNTSSDTINIDIHRD